MRMNIEIMKFIDLTFGRRIMFYCLAVVLILASCVDLSENANILVVSASLSRSNQVWNNAIAFGLAERGHNVTIVTPYVPHVIKVNKNVFYIILEGAISKFKPQIKTSVYDYNIPDLNEMKKVAKNNWDKAYRICEFYLNTQGLQTLLDYPSHFKFEVILWDLENSECMLPLIPKLGNPPVIILSPNGFQPTLNWIFGTHWKPYLPIPGLPYDKDMNFMRRFLNAVTIKFMYYQKYEVYLKENINLANEKFKNNFSIEDAMNLELDFSLALINSNFHMDYGRDVTQNKILVGGLHINPTQESKTITNANIKRIYVSLQDDKLDKKQLQGIADCLGSLDTFKVYWRVADVTGKIIKPKNIVFNETFNQIQILGSKNTKLFITSGNLLSLQEAVYFGVPILAIPSTYAQTNNVKKLPIATGAPGAINEKYLCRKIRGILNDDDYLENTKSNSDKFRDQPMKPLDRAMFWIEYVMRHGNGKHLEPLTRNMSYFESENIDLLFFAALFFICLPLTGLYLLIKCIQRRTINNDIKCNIKIKQD